jgi:hypothetical protein
MSPQPVTSMIKTLNDLVDRDRCLFALSDLRGALPDLSGGAFRTMISRAEKKGVLARVCRGLYLYRQPDCEQGLMLFHAAARLRAGEFNYISLETALSDAGVISQVPVNWVTIMSSGRRNIIRCGKWGSIEFVHTSRQPAEWRDDLTYDARCRLWRASVSLAIRDMRLTRRTMDLIDREVADELV